MATPSGVSHSCGKAGAGEPTGENGTVAKSGKFRMPASLAPGAGTGNWAEAPGTVPRNGRAVGTLVFSPKSAPIA